MTTRIATILALLAMASVVRAEPPAVNQKDACAMAVRRCTQERAKPTIEEFERDPKAYFTRHGGVEPARPSILTACDTLLAGCPTPSLFERFVETLVPAKKDKAKK